MRSSSLLLTPHALSLSLALAGHCALQDLLRKLNH